MNSVSTTIQIKNEKIVAAQEIPARIASMAFH
jgi:hypothetical protein